MKKLASISATILAGLATAALADGFDYIPGDLPLAQPPQSELTAYANTQMAPAQAPMGKGYLPNANMLNSGVASQMTAQYFDPSYGYAQQGYAQQGYGQMGYGQQMMGYPQMGYGMMAAPQMPAPQMMAPQMVAPAPTMVAPAQVAAVPAPTTQIIPAPTIAQPAPSFSEPAPVAAEPAPAPAPQVVEPPKAAPQQAAPAPAPMPRPVMAPQPTTVVTTVPPAPQAAQPVREIVRLQTRTVPERFRPYIGVNGSLPILTRATFNFAYDGDGNNAADMATLLNDNDPYVQGFSYNSVIGVECCSVFRRGNSKLRFELEGGQSRYTSEDIDISYNQAGTGLQEDAYGKVDVYTAALNTYLDMPVRNSNMKIYTGGGIGAAWASMNIDHDTGQNNGADFNMSDQTFMFQGMVGASFDIGNYITTNFGYRFRSYGDIGEEAENDTVNWGLDLAQIHTIEAGIRVNF